MNQQKTGPTTVSISHFNDPQQWLLHKLHAYTTPTRTTSTIKAILGSASSCKKKMTTTKSKVILPLGPKIEVNKTLCSCFQRSRLKLEHQPSNYSITSTNKKQAQPPYRFHTSMILSSGFYTNYT